MLRLAERFGLNEYNILPVWVFASLKKLLMRARNHRARSAFDLKTLALLAMTTPSTTPEIVVDHLQQPQDAFLAKAIHA